MARGWPADGRYLSGGVAWQAGVQEAQSKASKNLFSQAKFGEKHIPAIGLCVGGTGWGDQQSAQGGSLHTPTTDHSAQLITALP